ncbi:hypothetical protein [Actinokineospora sp. NBRC 105648]|uniref:hypothetical protein n=1 Tax=Actinokineospora sp. NBRC 105648 TaxID=3032206 RepID=UPI00249FA01F|nr:hypothetical protein [Actinokineospora sp. NBRC 105648]GLZ42244.1 hypothetical protein Acsp05_58680 [Actinokineospora sp. NBRC 105648]
MTNLDLNRRASELGPPPVVRAVTVIMGTVVGLTFLFGFGNVFDLALRLGVPVWVAPLVAPAIDLSVLGLLLAVRYLALAGVPATQLRSARRLLVFASLVTLALNVAGPIAVGEYGKAAFDAVGPMLLIGWAEVSPGLLQAMAASYRPSMESGSEGLGSTADEHPRVQLRSEEVLDSELEIAAEERRDDRGSSRTFDDLIERALHEDSRHWDQHRRPISAETLRKRLGVGAARSRMLVTAVRANQAKRPTFTSDTAAAQALRAAASPPPGTATPPAS